MSPLIKIASRNIWRNRKRSLLIIAAVVIGIWAGIFMMGFYNGMIEQRINNAIAGELSHIQLHHPEFGKDYQLQYYLPLGNKMLERMKYDNGVKAAAGRVIIKGMIASANGSSGVTINGVMPIEENMLTGLKKKIVSGKYFSLEKSNEILLGERLRKKLQLGLNKKAILTFQDREGNLASAAFRVIALFKTLNGPYDESMVFVKISTIDSLAGIPAAFNEIGVLLHAKQVLDDSKSKMVKDYPGAEIKTWKEISPELALTVSVGAQMAYLIMGIILMALAFGIINTMLMAVLERSHEIGMLLALGMNTYKIFLLILLETFLLILFGAAIGLVLALVSIAIAQHTGIDFSRYAEVYSSFGYDAIIYPKLTMTQLEMTLLLVVMTAIISTIFPARRAIKINPAASLKK